MVSPPVTHLPCSFRRLTEPAAPIRRRNSRHLTATVVPAPSVPLFSPFIRTAKMFFFLGKAWACLTQRSPKDLVPS
jgi:hypothetical protein